jgi:site-specific DNA-adenine methylase
MRSTGRPRKNLATRARSDGQIGFHRVESVAVPPRLRPFFGYYGGKWRDATKYYPAPKHSLIVEPFAGSAGYALRYAHLKVVLCELDPVIAGVWQYLTKVKASEIRRLPYLRPDQSLDDLHLPQEPSWLIGFWLNRATASPRKNPSKWMRSGIRPGSFWGERVRETIAKQVDVIRHWVVHNCSYEQCPVSGAATWFIDPPYQAAGKHYRLGSDQIDFGRLADWCTERQGQVIVCENEGADWLDFRPLANVKTTRRGRRSVEVIWTNEPREAVHQPRRRARP